MNFCARTDTGKIRKNNEDSIFGSRDKIGCFDNLFIVADGMGGHNAGEVASSLCILYINEYLNSNDVDLDTNGKIMDSIFNANHKIHNQSVNDKSHKGMGTTCTMATFKENKIFIGHVGDSRAYIHRKNKLIQKTSDHTYVNEMVKKGLMSKEQSLIDPNRNMITRAIGVDQTVMVDVIDESVFEGDIILLCSDGLSGLVEDVDIEAILNKDCEITQKCDELIEKALSNGGIDNVSVILISI